MVTRRFILLLFLLLAGCATSRVRQSHFDFSALPEYKNGPGYKLEKFIPAAMALQAMGRDAAFAAMLQAATNSEVASPGVYEKMVVLCRMLFIFQKGVEYRYPSLGQADFIGDTSYDDWPLEPIEVVDGYPFWIVRGFNFAGARRPVSSYVSYCITNCEWNTFHYRMLTTKEKEVALAKLLGSSKWKRPLNDRERSYLDSQITSTPPIIVMRPLSDPGGKGEEWWMAGTKPSELSKYTLNFMHPAVVTILHYASAPQAKKAFQMSWGGRPQAPKELKVVRWDAAHTWPTDMFLLKGNYAVGLYDLPLDFSVEERNRLLDALADFLAQAERDGSANGNQPFNSDTNQPSSTTGYRR